MARSDVPAKLPEAVGDKRLGAMAPRCDHDDGRRRLTGPNLAHETTFARRKSDQLGESLIVK